MSKRALHNQNDRPSFQLLTHMGVLKGKITRGEITAEQAAVFLVQGQNGGGPTRKERRRGLAQEVIGAVVPPQAG